MDATLREINQGARVLMSELANQRGGNNNAKSPSPARPTTKQNTSSPKPTAAVGSKYKQFLIGVMLFAAAIYFIKKHGRSFDDVGQMSRALKSHLQKLYFVSGKFAKDVIDRIIDFCNSETTVPRLTRKVGNTIKTSFLSTVSYIRKKIFKSSDQSTAVMVYQPHSSHAFLTDVITSTNPELQREYERFRMHLTKNYDTARKALRALKNAQSKDEEIIMPMSLKEYLQKGKALFFSIKTADNMYLNNIQKYEGILQGLPANDEKRGALENRLKSLETFYAGHQRRYSSTKVGRLDPDIITIDNPGIIDKPVTLAKIFIDSVGKK